MFKIQFWALLLMTLGTSSTVFAGVVSHSNCQIDIAKKFTKGSFIYQLLEKKGYHPNPALEKNSQVKAGHLMGTYFSKAKRASFISDYFTCSVSLRIDGLNSNGKAVRYYEFHTEWQDIKVSDFEIACSNLTQGWKKLAADIPSCKTNP